MNYTELRAINVIPLKYQSTASTCVVKHVYGKLQNAHLMRVCHGSENGNVRACSG